MVTSTDHNIQCTTLLDGISPYHTVEAVYLSQTDSIISLASLSIPRRYPPAEAIV